ncbi:MAG: hypothetical protein AAF389_06480 [Gemmatimonadota bacterium]
MTKTPFSAAVLLSVSLAVPTAGAAQVDLCLEAERFTRDVMAMQVIAEPDTIDDWRTQAEVPGCRVTAAGATASPAADVARAFYQVLSESGWVRTPDPQDAPAEASLRYRKAGADCLFNYYDQATSLNTDAELDVMDAVYLRAGQSIFNFLVLCTPAAPAAPRG